MTFRTIIFSLTCAFLINIPAVYSQKADNKNIYHEGWIDFNKNGIKDPYEDSKLPVEVRVKDLVSRMNLDEKTCQLATLYGYGRVLKDALPTPEWKNEIWKDGIANIDEHLNGFVGWNKPPSSNENVWPASKHAKAINIVQKFFVEETRLGIPVDFTNEGIRGVESYISTNFPMQIGQGCTWDKELIYEIGRITAAEARILGYTNVYAPILDVARDQRWGRFEETYGESPYLVGVLGVQMTKGMQENYQIASTAKHYAIYSANRGAREGLGRVDPQTTPRETHNIFLSPFKRVIRDAGLLGVMSSYNDYDGVPITGSKYYLTQLLRKEYGFHGYVVSDSDALEYLYEKHHTAATYKEAVRQAVDAGMNVRTTFRKPDMFIEPLRELVNEGQLSMDVIDSRVSDVLRVKFLVGLFDHPYVNNPEAADSIVHCAAHQQVALRAARESIVLLKNQNGILPLTKNIKTIAVCGPNANDTSYATSHYGSLAGNVTSVLRGIKAKLSKDVEILYTKGCDIVDANWPESEILPQPLTEIEKNEINKAVENAKKADVTIVVLGGSPRTSGENKSRTSLELPGKQLDLIKALNAAGKPVVLVLLNGAPMSINYPDKFIPAIIEAWFPGEKGGDAVADVIFGDYNPGGKLTSTFPKTAGQIPLNFPVKPNGNTDSGDAGVLGPIYPFGHGLSYTTFKYSNLKISPLKQYTSGDVTVTVDVENSGQREGDEVAQLYIRDEVTSVTTYEKDLKGFERVHLMPGEKKNITFTLKPEDLSLWNREMQFVVEPGFFKVMIGASSTDIRLQDRFEIIPVNNEVKE